MDKFHLS